MGVEVNQEGSCLPGPGTDPPPPPSPADHQWQSTPPPTCSWDVPVKSESSSLLSNEEIRRLRVLRCCVIFVAGFEEVLHILPHSLPPRPSIQSCPSSQRALAPEVSGSNQTNFLLNICKQSKMCLKQGTASFFTINVIVHFEYFLCNCFGANPCVNI